MMQLNWQRSVQTRSAKSGGAKEVPQHPVVSMAASHRVATQWVHAPHRQAWGHFMVLVDLRRRGTLQVTDT